MSSLLILGLILQVIAMLLILLRLQRRWLAYTGFWFVFICCIYHGFTELIQIAFPNMNFYRTIVDQADIDRWVVVVSLAIFVFALVYSLFLRPAPRKEHSGTPKLIDWRLGLIMILPCFMLLLSNLGVDKLGYWEKGLLGAFVPFIMVLTSVAFIVQTKSRYVIPVLFVQFFLMSLLGSRFAVVLCALVTLSALVRYRVSLPWKGIALLGIIGVFLMFAISSMRVEIGRGDFTDQTAGQRIKSLKVGAVSLFTKGLNPEIVKDFVYRFDGNAFNGMIYSALNSGSSPAGLTPLRINFFLMVPSFINPNKLDTDITQRSAESYMVKHFGLGVSYLKPDLIDYTPCLLGILFGMFGMPGILAVAALFGVLYAFADNWLLRSRTLFSVLFGIGLTYATIFLEKGLRTYISFRAIIALYVLLLVISALGFIFQKHLGRQKQYNYPRY